MLERIALHQTRLRTPGLGLEGKGVALGAKGLVLVPSLDRLVALLAVYTRERSLEDLLPSLSLHVVRSPLGNREITLEFAAESSDRMDRLSDATRLVGGFSFTGTSRHFVQYRDAAAPFGYDAAQLLTTDSALVLYHDKFTQIYDVERPIDLRSLLLRLTPRLDPASHDDAGVRYVVAERGLGAALIHYLVRSRVEGDVCMAEWPEGGAFDDGPVPRTIARLPELPPRMRRLMRETPGLATFVPAGVGVAVEAGFRHPVELRACPVFDAAGLVLLRGRGDAPWVLPRLPAMGPLRAFARVEMRAEDAGALVEASAVGAPAVVRVPLRVVPSAAPWRNVTATWIPAAQVPLLRKLAYALPRSVIGRTSVATTARGAFVRCPSGIEAVPLGTFFVEVHPGLFVPAGYDVAPAVAPAVLHAAIGADASRVVFVTTDAVAMLVAAQAFVPLEQALLAAPSLDDLTAVAALGALAGEAAPGEGEGGGSVEATLREEPLQWKLMPIGPFPMSGVEGLPPTAVVGGDDGQGEG